MGSEIIAVTPNFYWRIWNRVSTTVGRAIFISALNQAISSGCNFLLGFYLVRVLTPSEFGMYGIGFAVTLFYSGVGNALFLTQMVVHMPEKAVADRTAYASRIFVAVLVFSACTIAVVLPIFHISQVYFSKLGDIKFVLSVAAVSITYLLKDFFVRYAYTEKKEVRALLVNSSIAITLIASLIVCKINSYTLSAGVSLVILALGQFVGAIVGAIFARLPFHSVRLNDVIADTVEAFRGGKWAVGGVSVTWAQSQAYTYVAAISIGPAGVGFANAARMLISPFTFIVPAINQVVMPRLAELRMTEKRKMVKLAASVTILLLTLAVVYSCVVLGLVDFIGPAVLGSKYKGIAPLAAVWCIVVFLQLLRDGAGTILQVMKEFRVLMIVNIFSAIIAVSSAVIMMNVWGVSGAVLGTGIGELFLAFFLWTLVRRICFAVD